MPKRSNEFQRLIDQIHRLYAPKGAKITTSAMMIPAVGPPAREVDILVELETDLYPVKIAVEAKDHSRPIDVTGVEQYIGKYDSKGGITVDKVIIVAKSFTPAARKRAEALGFNLHTITSLSEGAIGAFSKVSLEKGRWCVSKKVGNEVRVVLLDKKGNVVPLQSTITPRKSKIDLGSGYAWARRLLDNCLGRMARQEFNESEGEMVHVKAEFKFADHKARIGSKSVNLSKMVFDFGERMIFPETETEEYELKKDSGETKRIIRETGAGKTAKVSLTYEKESSPKKLYLNHESLSGEPLKAKKVVIRI